MEQSEHIDITKDVVEKYYEAMRCVNEYFGEPMKEFAKQYPLEFKRLNSIHCKRVKIRANIEAMKLLCRPLQFGTLTFDEIKDRNKIVCKRKEAFAFLNTIFQYVLLVEENGEEFGRYHIHFVGVYRYDKTFEDFISGWHSRQNIKTLKEDSNICGYLCKYLSKQIPRIRRNKQLIALERAYSKRKCLKRSFPSLFNEDMRNIHTQITIFDL